jgi:protein-tyrosine phosphatase
MVIDLAPPTLPQPPAPFRVLVVSDRSTCRGPAVQRLLGAHLRAGGGHADVVLGCAGVAAGAGDPMHPDTARALAELDVDAGGHAARRLTERRVAQADLVLTVAREQLRAVTGLRPDAAARTFPLLELARLAAAAEGGPTPAGRNGSLRARVTALDALRALPTRGTGADGAAGDTDDVDDPADGGYARHRRMVRAVDVVTLQVARLLTVAAAAGRTAAAPAAPAV